MANPIELKSILVYSYLCDFSGVFILHMAANWNPDNRKTKPSFSHTPILLFLTLLYSCIKVSYIEIYAAGFFSGQTGTKRKIKIYKNQPIEKNPGVLQRIQPGAARPQEPIL